MDDLSKSRCPGNSLSLRLSQGLIQGLTDADVASCLLGPTVEGGHHDSLVRFSCNRWLRRDLDQKQLRKINMLTMLAIAAAGVGFMALVYAEVAFLTRH